MVSHRSHHIDAFYMIYDNMNSQKQFQQEDLHWGNVEKDLAIWFWAHSGSKMRNFETIKVNSDQIAWKGLNYDWSEPIQTVVSPCKTKSDKRKTKNKSWLYSFI